MKVLILGAGGQLGQALHRTLPDGWDAAALTREYLDIGDDAALNRAIEPELVVNTAAYTAVDAAEDDEDQAYRINRDAPRRITNACAQTGARLIHISTDYVFDGQGSQTHSPDAVTNPINAYGRSKRAGEEAVLSHPGTLLVRTSWLYAASGHNFATTILRLLVERDEITVVSDQIAVPTHADSLARAVWKLAQHGTVGTHHFTGAGTANWYEFASAIAKKARKLGLDTNCHISPVTTAEYGAQEASLRFNVLDCAAAWPITGTPRHWEEELDIMLTEWIAAR
jgi:dTDP-4-dehydrorhamnose reductase